MRSNDCVSVFKQLACLNLQEVVLSLLTCGFGKKKSEEVVLTLRQQCQLSERHRP